MSQSNGDTHPAATKQYTPRLIFWEVTKGCNLRCIHCRATATELMSPADLPTDKALDIISQIADFGNPILVLSGGEPLYRHDIFQLAEYATSRGLRVALATNGTLVTKDVAQKIKQAGIKRVSISLDGSDAHTHDSFRGIPGRVRRRCLWHAQPSGAGSFGADQHHHRAPQRAPVAGRARPGAQPWAPMRCIPSCWCPWDAEWISPPSRW